MPWCTFMSYWYGLFAGCGTAPGKAGWTGVSGEASTLPSMRVSCGEGMGWGIPNMGG